MSPETAITPHLHSTFRTTLHDVPLPKDADPAGISVATFDDNWYFSSSTVSFQTIENQVAYTNMIATAQFHFKMNKKLLQLYSQMSEVQISIEIVLNTED